MNDIRAWFNKKQDNFYPETKEGANILTSRITTIGLSVFNTGIEILSGYGATVENYSDALTRLFNLGISIKIPEYGANIDTIIMKEYNSIEDIQIISLTLLGKNIMVPCSKNDAALLATINSEEQIRPLIQIAQLTYFKTEKTDLSATWNYKPSGSSGTVWSWEVNMTPDKESFYINALCAD